MKNSLFSLVLLLVILILCNGCEKDEFNLTDSSIEDILSGQNQFDTNEVFFRSDSSETFSENRDGENWLCQYINVDASISPDEYYLHNPNAGVILPGNLIQGNSIQRGTPEPAVIPRGEGKIAITTNNGSEIAQADLTEVTPSNIIQAMNDILAGSSGIVPANFNINIQRIRTKEELSLHIKAKLDIGLFNGGAQFDFDSEDEFNRILVVLNQSYYSMIFDTPSNISGFFSPSVTEDQLLSISGPNNPLTYISEVNYGRKYVLLFQSKISQDSLFASANASFLGNSVSGSITNLDRIEDLQIEAFALGGEANDAIRAVTNSLSETREFLAGSGDIRTGMPLSYVLRSVVTNQVVKTSIATQYTYTDCRPVSVSVQPNIWYKSNRASFEYFTDGENYVTKWDDVTSNSMDAVYDFDFNSLVRPPVVNDNQLNGESVVEFSSGGGGLLGAPSVSFLNFWAGNQNSNGYTVSAVMKWEGGYDLLNEDCRTPFLGSYSTSMPIDDPSDFSIGFEGQNTIYVNHAGQISYINLPLGITDEYRIYTITYSQSGTLEVYVNSGLIDTIQNVNPIERLQNGFLGLGRLGCSGILKVGEFLIYDRPLTNEERNAIEEELFIEYRL